MGKKNRQRKQTGFANTKKVPHENHPAFYDKGKVSSDKKKGKIRYVTFTHSGEVEISGKKTVTIPLPDNINPQERGALGADGTPLISHVLPKVYEGERGSLGEERRDLELTKASRDIVDRVFEECPVEQVRYTSNSKNKKKR